MIFRNDQNQLHKIDIPFEAEDEFLKAQEGGKIEFIKIDFDKLPKVDNRFKKHFFKVDKGEIVADMDRIEEAWMDDLYKQVESYIYANYSQVKQNSDLADKLYYENILKAKVDENRNKVYPDLETMIVSKVIGFENGKSLEELVADIPDKDKTAVEQLLKVGIRVAWVQKCKTELKKAIKEDREPNYPKYPL